MVIKILGKKQSKKYEQVKNLNTFENLFITEICPS